jgi:uncharacterized protein
VSATRVAGVARDGGNPANLIYRRLRSEGYDVVPVNPNAEQVEGDRCYRSVGEIPGGVEGVVVASPPGYAAAVVADCADSGVRRVWLHRSFGSGSVSAEAVAAARDRDVAIIAGGCPMMFMDPVDPGHRCMRWILDKLGKLPAPADLTLS